MSRPCCLYRCFGADGELLYIGISVHALDRANGHNGASDWFSSVMRIDVEHFPSRELALKAERIAIKTEAPKFNLAHNPRRPKKVSTPVEINAPFAPMPETTYVTPKEAAAFIGVSAPWLYQRLQRNIGPPFVRRGRKILLPEKELLKWDKQERVP